MPSKRTATLALAEDEDLTRSFADWNAFRLPSLRLKCNQYSLSEKGNKDEIIDRLIDKMRELEEERLSNENNNDTDEPCLLYTSPSPRDS